MSSSVVRTSLMISVAACYLLWMVTYLAQLHPLIGKIIWVLDVVNSFVFQLPYVVRPRHDEIVVSLDKRALIPCNSCIFYYLTIAKVLETDRTIRNCNPHVSSAIVQFMWYRRFYRRPSLLLNSPSSVAPGVPSQLHSNQYFFVLGTPTLQRL